MSPPSRSFLATFFTIRYPLPAFPPGRVLGAAAPVHGGVCARVAGQSGADAAGLLFGGDGERFVWVAAGFRGRKRAVVVVAP